MSAVGVVARKELRASFQSPVALIFLGIFLLSTLYCFFGYSTFFARDIADVRPLFEWLPLLLIFLVAAITMRQWAEERKMGTLEVLLTLPVDTRSFVLGKFAAGLALVAIALALTLPLPIMVSLLGDLDWGPVFGGYLAALFLGATYVAIGLCVSARTDNQVVALMLTLVIGGLLYFIGSERVTALFGDADALLRALGTGSRFQSIERGVLDLRDVAYYAGLAVFFLFLNWHFLELERLDTHSQAGRRRQRSLWLAVLLVGANVVALDVWLAPVARARVDLTQDGEYSISDVTRQTLAGLAEPLRIDGYFSARTHPLLAPLVPQIKDMLEEYAIAGGGRVTVHFADPNADEALGQELAEQYQIRPVPFRIADRHQQAVVNAYFDVLLRYGDQYESLSFDDLIEVLSDDEEIHVRLRNLEYDLTRTIKRLSQNFQNMAFVFSRLPAPVKVTLYATPDTLPKDFADVPARVRAAAAKLAEKADGKLVFQEVDPTHDAALRKRLKDKFGIEPLALDLFGRRTFYLDVLLEGGGGDRFERVLPRSDLGENDLRVAMESGIRRLTPGQLKTIGLFTAQPEAPPFNPNLPPQMQPPPPHPDYRILEQLLSEDYEVKRVDLADGIVPDVVDVLLVAKPGAMTERQQFAVDQYLMRGGKVIVMASKFAIRPERGGLTASRDGSPIASMLSTWGVDVGDSLVMDPQNAPFPIPVNEQHGQFRVQRIRLVPYPFFPDIRHDGFASKSPIFQGLGNATTPWASPLKLDPPEGVEAKVWLRTSPGSWLNKSGSIDPDFRRYPEEGFGRTGDAAAQTVAVSLSGRFPSYFADKPSPLFEGAKGEAAKQGADRTGRTAKQSLPDARLVVFGAPEMVSDLMMQIAAGPGGEVHRSNLQLLQNVVDWSVEDTSLLSIRSSGAYARTLRPLSEAEAQRWETGQYGLALMLLAAIALVPAQRRRHAHPLEVPSP